MATFDVDVEGVTYEVDAPDENTAWKYANKFHANQPKPMSGTEVALGFGQNLIPSVAKRVADTAVGVYNFAKNPAESTVGALGGMKNLFTGALQNVRNVSPPEFRGVAPAFDTSTADALARSLKEGYGGIEQIKRTLATDPARPLSDASLLLTSGGMGLAQLPGKIGTVGKAIETVGRNIDPIGTTVKATASLAKAIPREALGFSTGAGGKSISEATKAGYAGGKQAEAFRENISSRASTSDVVDQAKSALEKIKADRSKAYTSGMVDIKSDASIIDMKPISDKVDEVRNRGFFKDKIIDKSAADTWTEIKAEIDDWIKSDPLEYHTPEGLDQLKRRIGDIKNSKVPGTASFNAASNVFNAIRGEIVSQAPTYARVMKEYSDTSDLISEIEGALSLKNKALADTGLRKLQSLMRNNVQTNYGRRAELGDILAKNGADTLYPSLAGQSLSSLAPRSMSGQLAGVGGLATAGSAMSLPILIATLGLTSPKIVGKSAYYTGKVAGAPQRLIAMLGKYGDKLGQTNPQMGFLIDYAKRAGGAVDPTIARLLAEQLSRMQQSEERQAQ